MTNDHTQHREDYSVNHEYYFPTPICSRDFNNHQLLNRHLLENIYRWQADNPDGINRSNFRQAGSWHSDINMHQQAQFNELTNAILEMAQSVFDQQLYHTDYQPVIDSMWANINPRNGYNRSHSHPDTLWSGVYYVQAPDHCGRLSFSDPRLQARVITPILSTAAAHNLNSWPEVYFEAVAGRLILFPGWLVHEVEPNLSDLPGDTGNRVSVSFNIYQAKRAAKHE